MFYEFTFVETIINFLKKDFIFKAEIFLLQERVNNALKVNRFDHSGNTEAYVNPVIIILTSP